MANYNEPIEGKDNIQEGEALNATSQTTDDALTEGGSTLRKPERRHSRPKERGKFFLLRNILNTVFIIGAVVGMLVYFFKNEEVGTIIVLGSMSVKMCECVIRLVK